MQIFAVLSQNMSYEGDDQRIHHQFPVCKRSMEGLGRVLIVHSEIRTVPIHISYPVFRPSRTALVVIAGLLCLTKVRLTIKAI